MTPNTDKDTTVIEDKAVKLRLDFENRGYTEIPAHGDLRKGVRGRHIGDQYSEAYRSGTATIIAVFERPGPRLDIELIVESTRHGRAEAVAWANYHFAIVHVEPIEPVEPADTPFNFDTATDEEKQAERTADVLRSYNLVSGRILETIEEAPTDLALELAHEAGLREVQAAAIRSCIEWLSNTAHAKTLAVELDWYLGGRHGITATSGGPND